MSKQTKKDDSISGEKTPKKKKIKIRISDKDWEAIKGITQAHNMTLYAIGDENFLTPEEVAAVILHIGLERITPTEIMTALKHES